MPIFQSVLASLEIIFIFLVINGSADRVGVLQTTQLRNGIFTLALYRTGQCKHMGWNQLMMSWVRFSTLTGTMTLQLYMHISPKCINQGAIYSMGARGSLTPLHKPSHGNGASTMRRLNSVIQCSCN